MDFYNFNKEEERRKVAIVSARHSFSVMGIRKKLLEEGYDGIAVKPSVFQIEEAIEDNDPIIYYMDDDIYTPHGEAFLTDLKDLCIEQNRLVILVGASEEYDKAIEIVPKSAIVGWFSRPVDMDALLDTVKSAVNGEISPAKKHHILIVDDDPTYMRMMHEWMKERYQITMLDAGSTAIHWLMEGNEADLILLDYEMPYMDGMQVFSMMKSDPTIKDIPVMFLTGKDDKSIVMKAIDLKPVDYILKSIDKRSLMDKLEDFFTKENNKQT
ncbi:MAG: response regulator [Pseudobutyrivibrio sp.]|nr:response regulator [Pseudobutyrivibrio sp.]